MNNSPPAAALIFVCALAALCSPPVRAQSRQRSPAPAAWQTAQAPRSKAAGARVYRGTIYGRGVEVILGREGERVSGSYGYDGAGGRLRLEGRVAADGKLTLAEYDRAGRQTGRFACEPGGAGDSFALDIDLECEWSRTGGADRTYAGLTEQHAAFTRAWRVEPRSVENRRYGARVTYPQIAGARLSPGALAFNRGAAALAARIVREFASGPPEPGMYLRANYDVLLATDEVVSVELEEENDYGGGRPNTKYYGLTYDLRRAGRELRLAELFKPGSGFERALLLHSHGEINRKYKEIGRREAAPGAPPEAGELIQPGREDEIAAWTMTTRGLLIYYNFPQVMAAFDRNFVPYSAVKDLLRPDGPAAGVAR